MITDDNGVYQELDVRLQGISKDDEGRAINLRVFRTPAIEVSAVFKSFRWLHIVLEVIGGLTVITGLVYGAFYFFFIVPMSHFSDGNCNPDTEQRLVNAPDGGEHNFKSLHRNCGKYHSFFAYLSTGNPNKGFEYEPIIELDDVPPGAAKAEWDGPNRIVVTFPKSANVVDHYARSFGIDVVLDPK